MTPRLSGHFSVLGVVFFVLKSLQGIAKQWSRKKFAILTLKPRSHVRILIYRTWAIQGTRLSRSLEQAKGCSEVVANATNRDTVERKPVFIF